MKTEKIIGNAEKSIRGLWDMVKWCNVCNWNPERGGECRNYIQKVNGHEFS
jgi:hypothetical protein